jgi:hypothetical protein
MQRFAAFALGFALAVAPMGSAVYAAYNEDGLGTHPYDQSSRKSSGRNRNSGTLGYRAIENFYYSHHRTQTHALHPYYRGRYPYVFNYDPLELSRLRPYPFANEAQVPSWQETCGGCNNYRYRQDTQWTPPYNYECLGSQCALPY